MNEKKHGKFLGSIAKETGKWIKDNPAKVNLLNHFREQIRIFRDQREIYQQAVEHDRQAAMSNPRLWDKRKGAPKGGYVWYDQERVGGIRAQMVVDLVSTGLQVSELAALKIEDVDLKRGCLSVIRSKGKKKRRETLAIGKPLKHLKKYIGWTGRKNGFLFDAGDGRKKSSKGPKGPLSVEELQRMIKTFREGYWRRSKEKLLRNPFDKLAFPQRSIMEAMFPSQVARGRIENLSAYYPTYYALLTAIHDSRGVDDIKISDGIWPEDFEEDWVGRVMYHIIWRPENEEDNTGDRLRKYIEIIVERVRANLDNLLAGPGTGEQPVETGQKTEDEAGEVVPTDLITLTVAIHDFHVSRATLYRAKKEGRLKNYSKNKHLLLVSRSAVASQYPKK